jgi:hypothetical protein
LILGSYSDLKIIKTRSVVQIVVEVPLDRGKEVTDLFGLPQPNAEIAVLVSRWDQAAADRGEPPLIELPRTPQIEHANDDADDAKQRAPMTLAQSAGFLCGTPTFQQFIYEKSDGWDHRPTKDEAAEWLRSICGVASRADIKPENPVAAERFRKVRADYNAWMLVA